MLETLRNAWKIPDLRKRMTFTLLILLIYRIGSVAIPVPYLNPGVMSQMLSGEGNLLGFFNILSGGAFEQATLFALGISPYITASIVIQLLTVAIPALERMAKEGEDGRKKINKINRYTTLGLALMQAVAYYFLLRNQGALAYRDGFSGVFSAIVIIICFITGGLVVMWLGERIDEKGIGNGISMMLFAGIVSRAPHIVALMWQYLQIGGKYYFFVPLIIALFVVLIGFIVWMTNAERRIPIQYAKRVVGRKMYGGQSSFVPIKVNMSGVMPIIFASSLLAIPGTIRSFAQLKEGGFWDTVLGWFNYNNWLYAILYFLLIIAFNYFYVAIQYNPIEMANNLRRNNGAIPGIRPGKPTSDFISRVISRVTLVGAIFLGLIAILPIALGAISGMNISLGGTTIIIVVGVALDFVRQLESQMMMRHYKGFLE